VAVVEGLAGIGTPDDDAAGLGEYGDVGGWTLFAATTTATSWS
jgi:hypothetical protein